MCSTGYKFCPGFLKCGLGISPLTTLPLYFKIYWRWNLKSKGMCFVWIVIDLNNACPWTCVYICTYVRTYVGAWSRIQEIANDSVFSPEKPLQRVHWISLVDVEEYRLPITSIDVVLPTPHDCSGAFQRGYSARFTASRRALKEAGKVQYSSKTA